MTNKNIDKNLLSDYFSIPAPKKKRRVSKFEKLEARATEMDFALIKDEAPSDPDCRYELYDNKNYVGYLFRTLKEVEGQIERFETKGRPQPRKPQSFGFCLDTLRFTD